MSNACRLVVIVSGLLLTTTAAQAQQLPVPSEKNPDWVLQRKKVPTGTQFRGTDPMPNAMKRSITSIGDQHYHWDASRQLRYDWRSLPNRTAPADSVTVHEYVTGASYTYLRKVRRIEPEPRQWRRLAPSK